LIGTNSLDDAGVYRLRDDLALVQTVDFFTPIVDDPYAFGQIAAANALSDIYAMGATPLTVLNIVGYPIEKLPPDMLARILEGGADKVREAGAVIVGGHSIDDPEPKFGMAVTGTCHPDAIWSNAGAKVGDVVVLTKPLGAGVMTTGIKRGLATTKDIDDITAVMSELNKRAAEVGRLHRIHACTDVTGFGLLGHALEMANGSHLGIRIVADDVPIMPRAMDFIQAGSVPSGSKRNLNHVLPHVMFDDAISEAMRTLLADSVTSGGLLMALPEKEAHHFIQDLWDQGVGHARIIGEVIEQPKIIVV
jgi:selenide,water dikinase